MKILYSNQFKTALVCAMLLVTQSCGPTVPGSWRNEKIKSGKRDDFHQLNTEVLRRLKANGLKSFLCKDMVGNNTERQVELISNRLKDNDYDLLDEYYVVNKYRDTDTVRTTNGEINRYRLLYPAKTTEMYMAYFVPKKSDNKYMISLIYGRFDYGWKIVKMDIAPYTINGKTAPELFSLAKDQYDKKECQAAMNNVILAVQCFEPGSYWQYPDEVDAGQFYTKVHAQVNLQYHYPFILSQVPSGPMIWRVYNQKTDDGTFPAVYYMTHYNLKDTTAVKKENMLIRKAVEKMIPGLHENNKCILYSAYNKPPTAYASIDHFDMTDKAR
jgi:hypothetical protein